MVRTQLNWKKPIISPHTLEQPFISALAKFVCERNLRNINLIFSLQLELQHISVMKTLKKKRCFFFSNRNIFSYKHGWTKQTSESAQTKYSVYQGGVQGSHEANGQRATKKRGLETCGGEKDVLVNKGIGTLYGIIPFLLGTRLWNPSGADVGHVSRHYGGTPEH